jgi:hypothetical protein
MQKYNIAFILKNKIRLTLNIAVRKQRKNRPAVRCKYLT